MSKTLSNRINFTSDEDKKLPFRTGFYGILVSGDLGGGTLNVLTEDNVPYDYSFSDVGMYGFTLITSHTILSFSGSSNPDCYVSVVDLQQRTI